MMDYDTLSLLEGGVSDKDNPCLVKTTTKIVTFKYLY